VGFLQQLVQLCSGGSGKRASSKCQARKPVAISRQRQRQRASESKDTGKWTDSFSPFLKREAFLFSVSAKDCERRKFVRRLKM
jgi:hypothetical protein